jgi:hypothetical protein
MEGTIVPGFNLIKRHGHGSHSSISGNTGLAYKPGHIGFKNMN